MYGNGAVIGMENTSKKNRRIQRDFRVGRLAWAVEAVGATVPGAVVRRTVTVSTPEVDTTSLGSASLSPSNNQSSWERSS